MSQFSVFTDIWKILTIRGLDWSAYKCGNQTRKGRTKSGIHDSTNSTKIHRKGRNPKYFTEIQQRLNKTPRAAPLTDGSR